MLLAARISGYPTMIHEQNAFPGLANRVLARWMKAVAIAFPDAASKLNRKDAAVTGNPIRAELFAAKRQPRTGNKQRLLVFGGSQGSHVLNEAMTGALMFLYQLKDQLEIVHQTGAKEVEQVRNAYRASAFADARVVTYLDPIADEIAAADLVVCRAGAMSIGDVAAVGRATILVPFALSADNHQEFNARTVERAGGAVVITEAQLTPERLASTIWELIGNPERTAQMGAAARKLVSPDATQKIVDLLEKIERTE
jgi:UDP-N-acetylglucosamine--N-acetylmuramyl-(pentapeptide) pyrophosphoryl-undecaprenol N-acetylglucosamine transferase